MPLGANEPWPRRAVADRAESTEHQNRNRRLRRVILSCAAGFLILGAIGGAWVGALAFSIKNELQSARELVSTLKDSVVRGDATSSVKTVSAFKLHTAAARKNATHPLWTLAAQIPWSGANFQAITTAATAADDVAQLAAAPLAAVSQTLDWQTLMPGKEGVNLAPLTAAKPQIQSAAHAVRQSVARLESIDVTRLLPQVSVPLVDARNQLAELRDGLQVASDAATIAPEMLGTEKPRRFLLLIQNSAELRSTGGIPGALAVLTVDRAKLTLGSQTSASTLGAFNPVIDVDSEQTRIYSARLGKFIQDVNLTPDFPTAAKTAQAMWETKTGEQLDGVLSIDPVALGYILDATGPVTIEDTLLPESARGSLPTVLTAQRVVPTLLSDVYSQIALPEMQDAYFAGVAKEVFAKISSGSGDAKKLLNGLTRGASERRVLLWSSKADEESVIARYPLGGAITGPSISPAQFGVYFNDGTGAKMDYYVKRTVQLIRECPANGYAEVGVRVTSTNTAPKDAATSLSDYVTGGGLFGVPSGTVQTNVTAYGPVQSNLESAIVGGKKTGFASYRHSGRPVGALTIRLAPGQSNTVEFSFGKIVQHTAPQLSVTPTVQGQKEVVLATRGAECAPPE
jgi:hypothetical protein